MIWLLFENARAVIKAEGVISSHGLTVKVIPAPATISSSCGMILVTTKEALPQISQILEKAKIKYTINEQ